ncbi:MAG: FUSC family protein [Bacteroidia bacterium]|nr:FUSC family protein [Bacteroidia bacterium]
MYNSVKQIVNEEVKTLFEVKQTKRLWHIPLLVAIASGVPLMIGLYFNNLPGSLLACLSGTIIVYMPSSTIVNRMITLLTCAFGYVLAVAIGLFFSFNSLLSAFALGLFAMGVHWLSIYFNTRNPGSFFFILIASITSCMPFSIETISQKIGTVALGTTWACLLALAYSLLIIKKYPPNVSQTISVAIQKAKYVNFFEALIIGVFMFVSLFTGYLLKLQNPYWFPISCIAVMQGASLRYIWRRSFQRILGTFVGLGLSWFLLLFTHTPLQICLSIITLQFITEMLIVRHYTLAAIFFTAMTIFLAEVGNPLILNPNELIYIRFWNIVLGSFIGVIGGWVLYHERTRNHSLRNVRKAHLVLKRKL